ncbi:MAG: hypothetical protein HOE26_09845 [Rhodospirillaceae bacterium]|jgi:hypothetical protein|nr:hypothetical protein [Rhodospirillaceae bacterium]MBT5014211.1 hypothetical protein [Rhodospirillaceae bacterium]MBT7357023.1 hypothetical protein [Rhodospirillaceae bacterium]
MLNGLNNANGVASVATAALQLALVQQTQFEQVLEDSVDRKREETENLKESAKFPKDEVVVETKSAEAAPAATPAPAAAPAESAEAVRGASVNIEI